MKNKLVRKNITKFDRRSRKFGILGVVLITSTLAFGIPMIVNLNSQNEILTKEVRNTNDKIATLQLQFENLEKEI